MKVHRLLAQRRTYRRDISAEKLAWMRRLTHRWTRCLGGALRSDQPAEEGGFGRGRVHPEEAVNSEGPPSAPTTPTLPPAPFEVMNFQRLLRANDMSTSPAPCGAI